MKRKGIEKESEKNRKGKKSSKKLVTVVMAVMIVSAVMTALIVSATPGNVEKFTIGPDKGITNAVSSYNATINTTGTGFSSLYITIPAGFGAVAPTSGDVQIAKVEFSNATIPQYANFTIKSNTTDWANKVVVDGYIGADYRQPEVLPVNYTAGGTTTISLSWTAAQATLKLPTSSATGYLSISLPASIGLKNATVNINQSVKNPADEGDYDFVAKADGETTGKVATVHIAPVSFAIKIEPNFDTKMANLTANASEALDDRPTVSIKRDSVDVTYNETSWNNPKREGNFSIATNGTYVINVSGYAAGNFGYGIATLNVSYIEIPIDVETEIPLPPEMKMSVNITTNATSSGSITVMRTNESEFEPPAGQTPIGFISINASAAIKNNVTNVTINVTYTDDEIVGVDESTLRIFYYNTTISDWEALEGGVNETGNYVWGNITHLTDFGVMGSSVYGVELTANSYTAFTKPGVNATYILTVKNTGNSTDNFTLVVDNLDDATIANLSTYTTPDLGEGTSWSLELNVTNATVTNGETFRVNVTARSEGNTSVFANITTTTTVTTAPYRTVTLVYNENNIGYNFIAWTGNETNASSLVTLINESSPGSLILGDFVAFYNTAEGRFNYFIVGVDNPGTLPEDFTIAQYGVVLVTVRTEVPFQMPVAPYAG